MCMYTAYMVIVSEALFYIYILFKIDRWFLNLNFAYIYHITVLPSA